MNIGIIGTGNMGTAFAKSLAKTPNNLLICSRYPEKATKLAESISEKVKGGSIKDSADFAEVIILAVPWPNIRDVISQLGDLSGKIIIDISNPVKADLSGLAVSEGTSASEEIAKMIPKAKVVKAFNTIFATVLESSPKFDNQNASVFYCGNDSDSKNKISQIISDLGYDPIDCGPLESARLLEKLGLVNISFGYKLGMGGNQAFKLLKR